MKAARFHAHHDVRVEDVSPPELKDNEILVAIEFVQEEMLPYAALIEPLTLIIGGGPIGLTLGLVLRARGARKIYITEPTTTRRAQAAEVADRVLNPAEENVGNVIRSLTEGKGVDVVFDCAGIKPGIEDGMNAIARCSTYINIAGWGGPCTLPPRNFMFKEVTMKGSMSYTEHDFKQTVEAFNSDRFSTSLILNELTNEHRIFRRRR